jgi:hypothetical protein
MLQIRDRYSGPLLADPSRFVPVATSSPGFDLREPGNVCQGTVGRPAPGEPAVFDPQYTKQKTVLGIHIVGFDSVANRAFEEAEDTIKHMFEGSELIELLVAEGAYVIITDAKQSVLELPEFSCLASSNAAGIYDHVCGVADSADYPVVTVNELDLLGDRFGPCRGLNILYHELGHLVHGWAVTPAEYLDVSLFYQEALDEGRYDGQYAARNPNEYFAEATQAYFLSVNRRGNRDAEWLKGYDPQIFALLEEVFGGN